MITVANNVFEVIEWSIEIEWRNAHTCERDARACRCLDPEIGKQCTILMWPFVVASYN